MFIFLIAHKWIPLAVAITLVIGVVYITGQQNLRMNANDPQIQLSEDAAAAIANGAAPLSLVSQTPVDLSTSLAPWVMVLDAQGKVLASGALLHGSAPELPAGVFDYTRTHGQDRVTFQPEPGVRQALVVTMVQGGTGGFVVAGRSLREVEAREDQLLQLCVLGGLGSLLITLVVVVFAEKFLKRQPE